MQISGFRHGSAPIVRRPFLVAHADTIFLYPLPLSFAIPIFQPDTSSKPHYPFALFFNSTLRKYCTEMQNDRGPPLINHVYHAHVSILLPACFLCSLFFSTSYYRTTTGIREIDDRPLETYTKKVCPGRSLSVAYFSLVSFARIVFFFFLFFHLDIIKVIVRSTRVI